MTNTLALTHIGGPTLLIEVAGWRILTDPTFDPPGGRYRFGWGTGSTKTIGPALRPADLGAIDVVLLTHDQHADNLDDAGRQVVAEVPLVLTTVAGARRLGRDARGLAAWDRTTLAHPGRPAILVTATPARHGPPLSGPVVGPVVGFALTSPALPDGALWITGDSVLHDGIRAVAERVRVDVAVVHLGGVRFPLTGPLRYTMTAAEGRALVQQVRPRVAIPVHYEGWSHFRDGGGGPDPQADLRQPPWTVLPPGRRTAVPRKGGAPVA